MTEKDNYERILGIESFLYLFPVIGLFLLWKEKNKLSRLYLAGGAFIGLLNLLLMISELVKYNLV